MFQKMRIWAENVCMFENPLPVVENETYTLKHTHLIIINKSKNERLRKMSDTCEHVCMSEVSEHVCMSPSMHVCLKHTYMLKQNQP